MLLELERIPAVAQAWLNRSGDLLAVRWRGPSADNRRVQTALQVQGLTAKELVGSARAEGFKGFPSGRNWYRAAEADRLSEEEAQVIAARLVRRLRKRLSLSDSRAEPMRLAFAQVCTHELIHHPAEPARARRVRFAKELLKTGRLLLDKNEIGILKGVLALGHRPLPDEV